MFIFYCDYDNLLTKPLIPLTILKIIGGVKMWENDRGEVKFTFTKVRDGNEWPISFFIFLF